MVLYGLFQLTGIFPCHTCQITASHLSNYSFKYLWICAGNLPLNEPDFSLSKHHPHIMRCIDFSKNTNFSVRAAYLIQPDFCSIFVQFYNALSSLKQHPRLGSKVERAFDLPKAKTFVHGVKNYYRIDTNIGN